MLRKLLLRTSAARRSLSGARAGAGASGSRVLPDRRPSPSLSPSPRGPASRFYASASSQVPGGTFVEHVDDGGADGPTSRPSAAISVDRSALCNPPEHSHEPTADSELVKHLKGIIKFRGGPISVAEYMEEVLTNPKAGFYINRDVFGMEGDFITSPEVSQMFGEMIGVWTMCMWEQMGQPSKVNLVELGPGRGTLMADLLRGTSKFKHFTEALHIHMVECSPTLRKLQHSNLKCIEGENVSQDVGHRTISTLAGTPVTWHAALEQVPSGLPTIIIAHEFYDALPIHQFQVLETLNCQLGGLTKRASRGWCEKMVDIQEDSSFRFVLSPQPTPANLYLMKRFQWATDEEIEKLNHIEICPTAMDLTQTIAKRISSDGGGALIVDYGQNGVISDSLQTCYNALERVTARASLLYIGDGFLGKAIRKHKFVDILDDPGSADLSAYVDFAAVKHSAEEASEDVSVHGPITQCQFLGALGINFRVEALLQNCTDEQAESLRAGYWQLVGEGEAPFWEGPDEQVPIGMGTQYLVTAIVNKKQGAPIPFS